MNREDIIRMAREAGLAEGIADGLNGEWKAEREFLERFAALVAAAEQQKMMERIRHIIVQSEKRGAAAEREACAKVCDAEASIEGIAQRCAAAIRARGQS